MKYSSSVVGNKQRVFENGQTSVRVRVIFNDLITYLPTSIKWNSKGINKNGLIRNNESLDSFIKASKEIEDIQIRIRQTFENSEIKDIAEFKELYLPKSNKLDFIEYYRSKARERLQKLEIQYSTYRVQNEAVNSLEIFKSKIAFDSINLMLIENYKLFLKKKGLERNTIWTRLKDIRTYMNLAIKDNIKFEYPFANFKFPKSKSKISYLSEADFQKIKNYYGYTENIYHKAVLQAFLFSCYTGLRISDIKAIKGKHIKGSKLVFEPQKTKLSESKRFTTIEIPLHNFALELMPYFVRELPIFHALPADTKINVRLKEISDFLKIDKFTFHDSRHTFATRFLASGGKVEVLQKLLGHENIKTTMIYVHIDNTHAANQINLLT